MPYFVAGVLVVSITLKFSSILTISRLATVHFIYIIGETLLKMGVLSLSIHNSLTTIMHKIDKFI